MHLGKYFQKKKRLSHPHTFFNSLSIEFLTELFKNLNLKIKNNRIKKYKIKKEI